MKKFHDALKNIYGSNSSGARTFQDLLNRPSSINEDAIDRPPLIECNVLLDEFPTVMETRKAVQQLSFGKAPGADPIPAEVYKAGGYLWQRI